MKNKIIKILSLLLLLLTLTFVYSCDQDAKILEGNNPGDLSVVTNIIGKDQANPNGDGSGEVVFTVSASNALTYNFFVDGAEVGNILDNTFNYTFLSPGTNDYNIEVIARSSDGFESKKVLDIRIFVFDPTISGNLIWSDEFSTNGQPSLDNWTFEIGNNNGWGNNESQYYTDRSDNVIIENGILKITAKREDYQGFEFTSARMLSKDKRSFKYGRVEARMKLPAGQGIWPAFWMMGQNIDQVGWPTCGEIDVMEYVGNRPDESFATVHYNDNGQASSGNDGYVIDDLTNEFKIYAVEWTAESLNFYVDGTLTFTFANNAALPFNQEFFMLLNVAMGGDFGGNIASDFTEGTLEVDYVRVYEL